MNILITGAGGQDGVLLTKRILASLPNANIFALSRDRTIFLERLHLVGGPALVDNFRRNSTFTTCNITDRKQVTYQMENIKPDVIFHLAAHVEPMLQRGSDGEITLGNMKGLIYILEACEKIKIYPQIINAGSSLMFGVVESGIADEKTPFRPVTPYGVGKVAAHQFADIFRANKSHRVSTAILFNHESILRDERWLPTKIIAGAIQIKLGKIDHLRLGDLNIGRDWCAAEDIVDGLFKIMEKQAVNQDFVLGSGTLTKIEQLLEIIFLKFKLNWRDFIISDKTLFRSNDTRGIKADISKAKRILEWGPQISTNDWVNKISEYQSKLAE